MSHVVNVGDSIKFTGEARIKSNVKGDLATERYCGVDWFDQKALDETNEYTITVGGTSDAVAVTGAGVIGVTMTTGTGDNEVSYFAATPLIFDISQSPAIEARVKITDVSGTFFGFFFSDAITESTPNSTIDADSGTVTATATDAVGFVVDADLGTSSVYCASVNTGAACQSVDTGLDWTDNQTKVLRIALDTSGNARFYVDGVQKGYIAAAVADVPLCAIFNAGTRAADGSNTVFIRYLKKFADVA